MKLMNKLVVLEYLHRATFEQWNPLIVNFLQWNWTKVSTTVNLEDCQKITELDDIGDT